MKYKNILYRNLEYVRIELFLGNKKAANKLLNGCIWLVRKYG